MGKKRVTRKATKKPRRIGSKDPRNKESYKNEVAEHGKKKEAPEQRTLTPGVPNYVDPNKQITITPMASNMFFEYNTALGPPYRVLIDTNFVNFAFQNKVDMIQGMMDCLLAKCTPYVTECVIGELEKMSHVYEKALRMVQDPRVVKLKCTHKGTYADDCLVHRVTDHRVYIVATNDKELKNRLRKIPGVPIMYVTRHKFAIERLPEANMQAPSQAKLKKS